MEFIGECIWVVTRAPIFGPHPLEQPRYRYAPFHARLMASNQASANTILKFNVEPRPGARQRLIIPNVFAGIRARTP